MQKNLETKGLRISLDQKSHERKMHLTQKYLERGMHVWTHLGLGGGIYWLWDLLALGSVGSEIFRSWGLSTINHEVCRSRDLPAPGSVNLGASWLSTIGSVDPGISVDLGASWLSTIGSVDPGISVDLGACWLSTIGSVDPGACWLSTIGSVDLGAGWLSTIGFVNTGICQPWCLSPL